jgi:hypothetical protein
MRGYLPDRADHWTVWLVAERQYGGHSPDSANSRSRYAATRAWARGPAWPGIVGYGEPVQLLSCRDEQRRDPALVHGLGHCRRSIQVRDPVNECLNPDQAPPGARKEALQKRGQQCGTRRVGYHG